MLTRRHLNQTSGRNIIQNSTLPFVLCIAIIPQYLYPGTLLIPTISCCLLSIFFFIHRPLMPFQPLQTSTVGIKWKKKALLSSRHSPVIHKISFQNKPVNMYRTLKTKNARLYQSWSGSSLSQSFLSPNSVIKHSKLILLRHLHFSFLSWVPDIALFFVWNPLPCCCLLQNTVLKNSDTRINVWPWSGVRADFFFLILINCNPL